MFVVHLNVKITKVTCPGVWLCPKGTVVLKLNVFQQTKKSRKIPPKFPLNFCETLTFQKLVTDDVDSITDILENEKIRIELIQWTALNSKFGIVLAKFEQYLCNIVEPFIIEENINETTNIDLLLPKTDYFPGIISPKANTTFQLQIDTRKHFRNIYKYPSVGKCTQCYPSRQRKVCHSDMHSFCDCSRKFNSSCSICNLSYDIHKKYEKLVHSKYYEYRSRGCSWYDGVPAITPTCQCCCCSLKQHLAFH